MHTVFLTDKFANTKVDEFKSGDQGTMDKKKIHITVLYKELTTYKQNASMTIMKCFLKQTRTNPFQYI
jgi:hypothetical protein